MGKIFKRRWMMHDMARQRVFDKREFLNILELLRRMDYNGIGLYLEGAMEFKTIDGVIREGVITYDDAKWIVEECKKRDLFVFPMTNVVGHMEHFLAQERFRGLKYDDMSQMDFDHPEAEAFAMQIVHEFNDAFGTGLVHIGGDEAKLPHEKMPDYAKFLAKICDNLLAEGIQPAIWDDLIWMDKELCEPFSRDVFLFDWNYYGHRPESIKFFREKGFKDLVVGPCDNSWETFITYQRVSGHLLAHTDIPVRPDEIEAFLEDEAETDDPEKLGAIITNWENNVGRNLWCQWSAFARAGLFMTGKLKARERNDELIEKTLFGRVTPYTSIVYMLHEVIDKHGLDHNWSPRLKNCLFGAPSLHAALLEAMEGKPAFVDDMDEALKTIYERLNGWTPADDIENYCLVSMLSLHDMLRAGLELVKAFAQRDSLYSKAAELQFKNPELAGQYLSRFISGVRRAIEEVCNARESYAWNLELVNVDKCDIERMDIVIDLLCELADGIEKALDKFERVPLPILEKTVIGCIDRNPFAAKVFK